MSTTIAAWLGLLLAAGGPGAQAGNLIHNGGFERDADGDGAADGWSFSGDPKGLDVKLSRPPGREGGRCQRMTCTRYERVSGWTHVMLCQLDHVKVKRGFRYRLTLWARAEDIADHGVGVALQETKDWQALGLRSWFVPTDAWRPYTFEFVAARTCTSDSRLQIWFNSTGTLWVDDVTLTEHPSPFGAGPRRPTRLLRPKPGRVNPVPNASFECGRAGWGSAARYDYGWGTPMSRLFGEVVEDKTAPHGRRCLKVSLNDRTRPVAYFDYFEPVRHAIEAPLAGNVGFVALEKGKRHVVSAWLRAEAEGTPVRLGVRYFDAHFHDTRLAAGPKWQRRHWAFKARHDAAYVVVGPDVRGWKRRDATLWIDAVQIEPAKDAKAVPSDFAPRAEVEIGLDTKTGRRVFFVGEEPRAVAMAAFGRPRKAAGIDMLLVPPAVGSRRRSRPGSSLWTPDSGAVGRSIEDLGSLERGFYRVELRVDNGEPVNDLAIAVLPRTARKDSVLGINHAYGWDDLARPCVQAGVVWARDWSLKWQHLQPAWGAAFDFAKADPQIERALKLGHRVLGLLPFPSAEWSSTAPPPEKPAKGYPANRVRLAHAPRDLAAFKAYVGACVKRYRGRITWWQCFNEPLYTSYALPRDAGYKPADYVRLVKAFHEAARAADPDCKVLAGPGGWTTSSGRDLEAMLAAGLGEVCDAIDLHVYPGWREPELFAGDLRAIRGILDARKVDKPLWLTEHAYYADDDPVAVPPKGWITPLPGEREQAERSIRLNLILLAGGVRKIFYHAGSAPSLNRDHPESIFFDHGGRPRMLLPAAAAFNELFGPKVAFVEDLSVPGEHRALLFRAGERSILAAWDTRDKDAATLRVPADGVILRDMLGGAITDGRAKLSSAPVFAVGKLAPAEMKKAARIGSE